MPLSDEPYSGSPVISRKSGYRQFYHKSRLSAMGRRAAFCCQSLLGMLREKKATGCSPR
jgi:hypothetical protein